MTKRLLPLAALALARLLLLGAGRGLVGAGPQPSHVAGVSRSGSSSRARRRVTAGYVSAPNDSDDADARLLLSRPTVRSSRAAAITSQRDGVERVAERARDASAEITGISLFGGEVTMQFVGAKRDARPRIRPAAPATSPARPSSGIGGSAVSGSALGDWGTISVGTGVGRRAPRRTARTAGTAASPRSTSA